MYQEQPGYKLMFNTLRAMYSNHPIRVDIAGSVESIYDITKDDLYLCYETFIIHQIWFYLFGDVNPQNMIDLVEQHEAKRNKTNQPKIERAEIDEPIEVNQHNVTEQMKLQSPRLMLGFKNQPLKESSEKYVQRDLEMTFFYELIFGETDFYQHLLNKDLIDETFGYQFVLEPSYSFSIITSATQQPDELKELLLNELKKYRGQLVDQEAFDLLKNNLSESLFQV